MIKSYDEALFILLMKYPFLGYFIQGCRLVWVDGDHDVDTAAVAINKNAEIKLILNKTFFKELTPEQRAGLLMHEVLHLIYTHLNYIIELKREDHFIGNLAADLDVNQYVPEKWLKEGAFTLEFLKEKKKVDLERKQTFYYYFNELKKLEEQERKEQENSQGGQGNQAAAGESDSQKFSLKEAKLMDNHESWSESSPGELTPEQKKMIIKEMVKDVEKECLGRGIGDHPQFIQKIIDQSFQESKVNWRVIFRKYLGRYLEFERASTRTRPNRRLGLKSMGKKKKSGPKTIFAVDVSASVTDDDYVKAISEVKQALKHYPQKTEVIFFESKITEIKKLSTISKMLPRSGNGGTNFDCVIEYANEKQVDVLIFLTDGEDYLNTKPEGYNTIWLLLRERSMSRDFPGKKILIKE